MYRNTGKIEIRNIEQCKNKKSINCQGWQFIDINKEEYVVKSEAKSKYILIDLANNEYII